jgi:hypothetical protein
MRLALTLTFTLTVGLAHADTSIAPAAPDAELAKCTGTDGPYRNDWQSAEVKKLTPLGLHLKVAAGKRHLLYATSHFDKPKRAVVVERTSGKTVATVAGEEDVALVEDDGGKLVGVLALHDTHPAPRHLQLYAPSGEPRWKMQPLLEGWSDSAATLVAGDLLVIAHFHRIATGSGLTALDLKTGTTRWKADVQQLMVSHSKYFNDVTLERRGDTLVMRGFEAAGCYVQTFDLATGKRLSSSIKKTW